MAPSTTTTTTTDLIFILMTNDINNDNRPDIHLGEERDAGTNNIQHVINEKNRPDIYLGDELDGGRFVGVFFSANELDLVHPVFEGRSRRPDDHPVPTRQRHVFIVFQSPRDRSVALSLTGRGGIGG